MGRALIASVMTTLPSSAQVLLEHATDHGPRLLVRTGQPLFGNSEVVGWSPHGWASDEPAVMLTGPIVEEVTLDGEAHRDTGELYSAYSIGRVIYRMWFRWAPGPAFADLWLHKG
jgi:hypothetical protein